MGKCLSPLNNETYLETHILYLETNNSGKNKAYIFMQNDPQEVICLFSLLFTYN